MKCDYPFNCGDCEFYDWERHYCAYTRIMRKKVMEHINFKWTGVRWSVVDAYFKKEGK